jgi:hypothetical protein
MTTAIIEYVGHHTYMPAVKVVRHRSTGMRKGFGASLLSILLLTGAVGAAAQSPSDQRKAGGMEIDVAKIKERTSDRTRGAEGRLHR